MASSIEFTTDQKNLTYQQIIDFYNFSSDKPLTILQVQELLGLINKADYILFALDGAMIVGIIRAISDGNDINFIDDIRVHPDYRRHGIGKELLTRMEQSLSKIVTHHLLTNGRDDQKKFYESLGYHQAISLEEFNFNNFIKEVEPHHKSELSN